MDGLGSVLSSVPGLGGYAAFAAVVIVAIRMLIKADQRYQAEAADHERTQTALDDERARRRRAEDDLSAMAREVRELKETVRRLEGRVVELTQRVGPG